MYGLPNFLSRGRAESCPNEVSLAAAAVAAAGAAVAAAVAAVYFIVGVYVGGG